MSYASSRTGVHTPRGSVTGLFHRAARAALPALLLAVCAVQLASTQAPQLGNALTTTESASPTRDIPLCC